MEASLGQRRLPDLVQDSKLETTVVDAFIVHHRDDSDEESFSAPEPEYWEDQERLASSWHSQVWLQKCVQGPAKRRGQLRAVKVIPLSKSKPNISELETLAKFSQRRYARCFVKMLGWFETPTSLCIAMKYFPLGDLQEHMNNALPEPDTRTITFQVLGGLNFMHTAGFAHRDIKPGNVLIERKPPEGEWWIKLSDFGISKRVDLSNCIMTSEEGTIPYMAPELFGHEPGSQVPIDFQAADMWALGEMVFRMLTKQPVFPSYRALLGYTVRPGSFPKAVLDKQGVGGQATDFIRSLMEPQPEGRSTTKASLSHVWLEPCKIKRPELPPPSRSGRGSHVSSLGHSAASTGSKPADPWATVESTSNTSLNTTLSGPGRGSLNSTVESNSSAPDPRLHEHSLSDSYGSHMEQQKKAQEENRPSASFSFPPPKQDEPNKNDQHEKSQRETAQSPPAFHLPSMPPASDFSLNNQNQRPQNNDMNDRFPDVQLLIDPSLTVMETESQENAPHHEGGFMGAAGKSQDEKRWVFPPFDAVQNHLLEESLQAQQDSFTSQTESLRLPDDSPQKAGGSADFDGHSSQGDGSEGEESLPSPPPKKMDEKMDDQPRTMSEISAIPTNGLPEGSGPTIPTDRHSQGGLKRVGDSEHSRFFVNLAARQAAIAATRGETQNRKSFRSEKEGTQNQQPQNNIPPRAGGSAEPVATGLGPMPYRPIEPRVYVHSGTESGGGTTLAPRFRTVDVPAPHKNVPYQPHTSRNSSDGDWDTEGEDAVSYYSSSDIDISSSVGHSEGGGEAEGHHDSRILENQAPDKPSLGNRNTGGSGHDGRASRRRVQVEYVVPGPVANGEGVNDNRELLQRNKRFTDAYDEGSHQLGPEGSSGAAKRVMDFFRRRGKARGDESEKGQGENDRDEDRRREEAEARRARRERMEVLNEETVARRARRERIKMLDEEAEARRPPRERTKMLNEETEARRVQRERTKMQYEEAEARRVRRERTKMQYEEDLIRAGY